MKKLLSFCAAMLFAASTYAADQVPLFNALLTMGKDQRFVLIDAAGKTSTWLKLGDDFDGYTLKSYDAAKTELQVERDGKATTLHLMSGAGVANAPAPVATPASLADAQEVLRVMHFDDMIAKTMEQQKKAMGDMMQAQVARSKIPAEDRDRFLAMQKKILDETMDSVTGPEMQATVAKIFSETYSKEELSSLGAFYATPAGQSMIAKQPEVQQKMMQFMMPKMAQIGPKMQELSKQLRAEQEARKAAAAAAAAPAPAAMESAK
jgi:hypothetical protein